MKKSAELPSRHLQGRKGGGPAPDLLAAQALAFLADDPDRLGRFLALTGLDPSTLRTASRQAHFTAAVLGHLAEDDALLVAFAAHAGLPPETVAAAARAVTTPEASDW